MAEIPKIAVAKMASCYNIHIKSMTAYVFPHICPYCYALESLDPATKERAKDFLEIANGHYHLNLMRWLKHQLRETGVGRIVDAYFRCTAGISPDCVSALLHKSKNFRGFFSHYRALHESSEEGRFIVLAKILDQDFCEDE
jgi:copper oxidase (laccase) domain-containing protein